MRIVPACLAAASLLVACSQSPAARSNTASASNTASPAGAAQPPGAAVSGIYLANGKPAVLTDVSIRPDQPFEGKAVKSFVFTVSSQAGDADAIEDAHQGKFGDALIVRVEEDGTIVGADLYHHGLDKTDGYISTVGVVSIDNYRVSGGQVFGHVTTGGPDDEGGQQINVDLTFHAKGP